MNCLDFAYFSVVKIYTRDWLTQQRTPENDYLCVYYANDCQWVKDRAMDEETNGCGGVCLVAITRMNMHEFAQHSDSRFSRFWHLDETYNDFLLKTELVSEPDCSCSVWRKELNTLPVKYVNNHTVKYSSCYEPFRN